jgi:hypothetical protein
LAESRSRCNVGNRDGKSAERDHSPNSSSTQHTKQEQQQVMSMLHGSMTPTATSTAPQLRASSAVSLFEKVLQKQPYVLVGVGRLPANLPAWLMLPAHMHMCLRMQNARSCDHPPKLVMLPDSVQQHLLASCVCSSVSTALSCAVLCCAELARQLLQLVTYVHQLLTLLHVPECHLFQPTCLHVHREL